MHVTKWLQGSRPITSDRCLKSKNPSSPQSRIVLPDLNRDASISSPLAGIDAHVIDLLAPLTPSACIRLEFSILVDEHLRRIRMLIKARYPRSLAPSTCQPNRVVWAFRLCRSCCIQLRLSSAQSVKETNTRILPKAAVGNGRNLCEHVTARSLARKRFATPPLG